DAVIELIRASHTPEQARNGLIERFGLTETQAQAILDLRLQRLTGMEREKIEAEYRELETTIAELQGILGDRALLMGVIREELLEVRERYADERRTSILEATGELSILDLIPSEQQVITLSVNGYIKRSSHDEYRMQRRGGRGSKGMSTRDEDSVREIFLGNTHSNLLVFTRCGRVYRLPVYTIPESGRGARGKPIVNLMNLEPQDEIAAVLSMEEFSEDLDLVFCSRRGLVKRTRFSEYRNLRSNGLIAYDCADGDELLTVVLTRTDQHVLIVTKNGKSIRFPGNEIRHTGRKSRGVRGIVLKEGKPAAPHPWSEDDEIVDLSVLEPDPDLLLLTISENGYGKRTPIDGADPERPIYRVQSRKGQGVINMAVDESTGRVAGSIQVHDDDLVMLMTDRGRVIKIPVVNIRETKGRASKGVRLMRIDPDSDERIVSVTRVVEESGSDDADAELLEETPESPSPEGEEG
ncbi:MAG: DNA gyrase C-terminal beta-propeller domain-containing protein, partial [Myxococcota bacterium]|nr:DNA gyrase C-terminal beta-propeller domain-containing protein [Myxococcota bacterium]